MRRHVNAFIAGLISPIASILGFDVYVCMCAGVAGVESWHLTRRAAGAPPPRRLRPYDGGALVAAGVDVAGPRIEIDVVAWGRDGQRWSMPADATPTDPA